MCRGGGVRTGGTLFVHAAVSLAHPSVPSPLAALSTEPSVANAGSRPAAGDLRRPPPAPPAAAVAARCAARLSESLALLLRAIDDEAAAARGRAAAAAAASTA